MELLKSWDDFPAALGEFVCQFWLADSLCFSPIFGCLWSHAPRALSKATGNRIVLLDYLQDLTTGPLGLCFDFCNSSAFYYFCLKRRTKNEGYTNPGQGHGGDGPVKHPEI